MELFRRSGNRRVVIANGATASSSIDIKGYCQYGVAFPAAWTAADLSWQVSLDGVTWYDIYDEGASQAKIVAATVASLAGKAITLDSIGLLLGPWNYVKFVSSVAQAADRVFWLQLKA